VDISDLTAHFAHAPASATAAVLAAWLAWRLWRRLFRAVIACAIVGVVVYLAFPQVMPHLVQEVRGTTTSER
jgi:4-amino-4-deoxy-L-arabinose transferase-like glycosyltransferase